MTPDEANLKIALAMDPGRKEKIMAKRKARERGDMKPEDIEAKRPRIELYRQYVEAGRPIDYIQPPPDPEIDNGRGN